MENRKYVKILVLIFISGLFIFQNNIAFAYSTNTHAYLTSEIFKFYNQNFPNNKISVELGDYLIDGSRREDDVPRWMNHFYDPVKDRGLTDSTLGNWQKSKDWAQDSANQNNATYKVPATIASVLTAIQQKSLRLITDETDFTWQRAIKFYVAGDKEKAMFILGHILHLIEDVSVPEHTRNDAHALNNPYESYAEKFSVYNPDNKLTQRLINKGPVFLNNLNSYFVGLASYSNINFYSINTIGAQSGYNNPEIDFTKAEKANGYYFIKNTNTDKENYYLATKNSLNTILISNFSDVSINNEIIKNSYWSLLSVKSVQYGAGIIDLFFKEVEAAKNDPNFNITKEKSFIGKAVDAMGVFVAQVGSTFNGIVSSTGSFLTNIFSNDNFRQIEQIDLTESQDFDENSESQKNDKAQVSPKKDNLKLSEADENVQAVEKLEQVKKIIEEKKDEDIFEEEKDPEKNIRNELELITEAKSIQCLFITDKLPSRSKIIINEVAWMGSLNSSSDEWIELKNISGGNVDVSNWQLIDKDEQVKINFTFIIGSKIIGPNKFILLERTDDDSAPSVKADLIYSGALSNTNEGLRLFDNQCNLIDEVFANPDWPAGNSSERKTMERDVNGLSWHTSSVVNGTPKAENSAASAPAQMVYSGGGSMNQTQQSVPVKILINEVQISPTGDRSIELYNPNDSAVNLTNWYIQRKTKTGNSFSSLISKTYFENKIIQAKGYFTISRSSPADIVLDSLTLTESNTIQIKNSSGDIIDKVGWGDASDCENSCASEPAENQSIERKLQNGAPMDTDNNAGDFELKNNQTGQSNQAPSAFFDYSPKSLQTGETVYFDASSSTDPILEIVSYEWSFGDGGTLISSTSSASHSYSRFGNYEVGLTVFNSAGASSTKTVKNISVSLNGAQYVVISEVFFDADGSDEGKEFVELYNPTNSKIDLSDYSIKILSGGATTTKNLAVLGSKSEDKKLIGSKGFLLIGLNNYVGNVVADVARSASLPNSSTTIYLVNSLGGIVDLVFYNDISNTGQSIERKAWVENTCVISQQDAEFSGNACDSNSDNDFDVREIPNPQNSLSLPEPRSAPTMPENLIIQYSQNEMMMSFSWDESFDYSGATSTLVYKIFDAGNASTTSLVTESTSTVARVVINEIGKNYEFSIQAFDKDGLGSDMATSSMNIPSLFSGLYFYQNLNNGEILIDAYYDQYPFTPDLFNKGDTWKLVVFYLNKEAKNDLNNPSWEPLDLTNVLKLKYDQCAGGTGGNSLILPDVSSGCGLFGGAQNVSFKKDKLEDNHFIVKTFKSATDLALGEGNFITVAFYSVSSIPTFDALNPEFQLVAIDKTKYYFGVEPTRQAPVLSGEIITEFDSINSKLNISWPKAMDADTLDNLLIYEIKYNDEDWVPVNNATGTYRFVSPGESFSINVRVKDDFNNYSASTLSENWAYPPINFSFIQGDSAGWSVNFGKREGTDKNVMAVNIQSILPTENLELNKVVLRVKHSQDTGSSFDLKFSVFGDNGGAPNFNNLISASTISGLVGDPQNRDLVFNFSPNIALSSGTKHWFVLENSSYTFHSYNDSTSNSWQSAVSGSDVYAGGESGQAFMRISGAGGFYIDGSANINLNADWYMKIGLGE